MTLTFDLLTLELVRNVSRGTDNLSASFGDYATFRIKCYGQNASDSRRDVVTLTFDFDVTAHVEMT